MYPIFVDAFFKVPLNVGDCQNADGLRIAQQASRCHDKKTNARSLKSPNVRSCALERGEEQQDG